MQRLYQLVETIRPYRWGSILIPVLFLIFSISFLSLDTRVRVPTPTPLPEVKVKDLSVWIAKTHKLCDSLSGREALDRCYRSILGEAVREEGTAIAVQVLELLRDQKVITAEFDDHQHVHEIGRATAQVLGITSQAFLTCPTTYNYGCHHGFFEYALSKTGSYRETATMICEDLKTTASPKLYSYCYHGAGHGIMMAKSYDLTASLALCDQLPGNAAQEGCWQGSLMENTNLAVTDEEKVRFISKTDPLVPCNTLPRKYQWQCYINHAGYLMKRTQLDIKKAGDICLSAPDEGWIPCVQSIGLMVTNPIWQKSTRGIDTVNDPKKNVETAWSMCLEMDKRALKDCVIGAIGNILNFDEIDITRARAFCETADAVYRHDCYRQIGASVFGQLNSPQDLGTICHTIADTTYQQDCLAPLHASSDSQFVPLSLGSDQERMLMKDEVFLTSAIKQSGPAQVIAALARIMPAHGLACHDRAHETGRVSYEVYGAQAFKLCSSECHSGCYHGAAEAYFHDKGTANLEQNLSTLCSGELNRFFSHQCVHGVGHGLMAWANYELFDALKSCDTLSGDMARHSCWTGVFMENIVGGLAREPGSQNFSPDRHYTKYVNSDPHYPCSRVEEKYKGACYFLQTSRMIQLYNSDFSRVAQACQEAPQSHQRSCFLSMGRDVGGNNKHNVSAMIEQCQYAPKGMARNACVSGSVQDTFWDRSGKMEAVKYCSRLTDSEELRECWYTIADRAGEVLSVAEYEQFCREIPSAARVTCKPQSSFKTYEMPTEQPHVSPVTVSRNTSGTQEIRMTDEAYIPNKITVKKGTRVVFRNVGTEAHWPASNIHPTHKIYPEFDAKKPINPGQTWEFVFGKVGIWQFHDHLLPYITGTITVSE